ncbi:hypothetical protein CXX84_17580 [Arthrobacter sp. AFG7.2]|nr:hypothetical protein CXX84_17580 [Arthrobacter sp. AFG7.2]
MGAVAALLATAAIVAGAVTVSSGFTGTDSDPATLRGFQIRVLNVSQAAAENRLDGALDALEALARDLDLAAGEGLISAARYRGISSALEAVRSDVGRGLTAQAAAAADEKAAVSVMETPAVNVTAPEPAPAPQQVQLQPQVPAAAAPVPEAPVLEPESAPQEKELPAAAQEAKSKGKGPGKP